MSPRTVKRFVIFFKTVTIGTETYLSEINPVQIIPTKRKFTGSHSLIISTFIGSSRMSRRPAVTSIIITAITLCRKSSVFVKRNPNELRTCLFTRIIDADATQ